MNFVRHWQKPFSLNQGDWQTWLLEAKIQSVSPVSQFKVGALAVGQSGKAYLGTNLEFKGLGIAQTVHAEQWAISEARRHGEASLEALLVTELPCGHCRQFLQELGSPDLPIYVLQDDSWIPYTLSQLLPEPFTLAGRNTGLLVSSQAWLQCPEAKDSSLVKLALEAAQKSYAPYTQSFSAVALETSNGQIFASGVIESAAYNPTLPPLQGALIGLLSSGAAFNDIERIVYLSRKEAPLSWKEETKNWKETYVPKAEFQGIEASLRVL